NQDAGFNRTLFWGGHVVRKRCAVVRCFLPSRQAKCQARSFLRKPDSTTKDTEGFAVVGRCRMATESGVQISHGLNTDGHRLFESGKQEHRKPVCLPIFLI